MIDEEEKFDNVIFTDESTFQVDYNVWRAYQRIGEPRILRQRPKHPAKFMSGEEYQEEVQPNLHFLSRT